MSNLPINEINGWKILGPGGGGCVHCLTINPLRPETMLVSCDMTNGFITHDGGQSWREFNLKSRFYSFAFDQHNADVIYAGSSGLFRSGDNGQTWQLLFPDPDAVTGEKRLGDEGNHFYTSSDNWPGGPITAIKPHPLHKDTIFICIKKSGLRFLGGDIKAEEEAAAQAGTWLYASGNNGKSWEQVASIEGVEIFFMYVDFDAPGFLYVFTEQGFFRIDLNSKLIASIGLPDAIIRIRFASHGVNPETGKTIFYLSAVSDRSRVWTSDDFGSTWSQDVTGLTVTEDSRGRLSSIRPSFSHVSACANDARTAYLIAEQYPAPDGTVQHGILKTVDQGRTWHWVVNMSDTRDPDNREMGWPERDYGAPWDDIVLEGHSQITPKGLFAWDVLTSPVDPNVCLTADYSTVFRTDDGGASWKQLVSHLHDDGSVSSRGLDLLTAYSLFFDPFDDDHIAAAHTDVGLFHSFNRGQTWHHALAGVPRAWINSCYWMVFDPEVPGRAWSVWSGLHVVPRMLNFVNKQCDGKFEGGICRTDSVDMAWTVSNDGIPSHCTPTHIVLDPASPAGNRTLYTAVFEHGVYKSTDDGKTWVLKNSGIDAGNLYAWRLALLPDGTLYLVVVAGHIPGREVAGTLYKSTDGAESWQKIALPDEVTDPNDLMYDPSNPKRLYLSCWPHVVDGQERGGGVYASDDGVAWNSVLDPQLHVYSVTVDETNPAILYATTFDAAVYRSDDRGATWHPLAGYDFCWGHRVVLDEHEPDTIYICTYGSSTWHGQPSHRYK